MKVAKNEITWWAYKYYMYIQSIFGDFVLKNLLKFTFSILSNAVSEMPSVSALLP